MGTLAGPSVRTRLGGALRRARQSAQLSTVEEKGGNFPADTNV